MGAGAWKTARLEGISRAGFCITWLFRPCEGHVTPGMHSGTASAASARLSAAAQRNRCEFAEPLHVAVCEHILRHCAVD
jgi:hypothetical protein